MLKVAQPLRAARDNLLTIPEVRVDGAGEVLAEVEDELGAGEQLAHKGDPLREYLAQQPHLSHERRVDLLESEHPGARRRVVQQQHQLPQRAAHVRCLAGGRRVRSGRAIAPGGWIEAPHGAEVDPRVVRLAADAISGHAVEHAEEMRAAAPAERDDEDRLDLFDRLARLGRRRGTPAPLVLSRHYPF
eukprot:2167060-Prymnesium_polylepis.1